MEAQVGSNGTPIGVVSVGEVLVDLIAPAAGNLESAEHFIRSAGGAPANVAVAVSRLGVRSALVSAVGADPFGRFVVGVLHQNGVATDHVITMDPAQGRTTLALVARNSGGIPDFVFYRGAEALLEPSSIPLRLIQSASFLFTSSMALMGEPAASATMHAMEIARAHNILISVDPNLRPSSWPSIDVALAAIRPTIEVADIVKVNDEEARLLTGELDPTRALSALAVRPEQLVVISLGSEGCIWRHHGRTGKASAPSVNVVDTTGAGDAFVGALLAHLYLRGVSAATFADLSPGDINGATRFACAAAAVSCTVAGAMPALPTRAQAEELLVQVDG